MAPRYRLAFGRTRARGRAGAQRGLGAGSSLELLDFRAYAPGDDLRHVDWRGYARSEQLRVRLHQEEVAPHLDVVLDASASMASTAGKERAARLLAAAFVQWGRREGAAVRLLTLDGAPVEAATVAFAGADGPPPSALPLRPRGLRVLLTDGLWAGEPSLRLRPLQAAAARCLCVQLLDPWELAPAAAGACTLVDAETGARRELQLDAATVAAYGRRLQRLVDGLRAAVVGPGGAFVQVVAASLAAMADGALVPAGVLESA
ncbi:MAG: DUF58 domain-containing protein [Planctomycetes bacterium]|nr:DUF58 domain-containing protein [Planctomycetota bacterium]